MTAGPSTREQSRARYPDSEGYVEHAGVRVFYEVYGDTGPTVLLVPPWSIVYSRVWKMQIPYLARHCRVVTFDPRGNGRSDRPATPDAYTEAEFAADALAVLDATDTNQAFVVTLSSGSERALLLAADHPERVRGVVFIAPSLRLAPPHPTRHFEFADTLETNEGWAKYNAGYWRHDYPDFVDFFMSQCVTEPHSTKLFEDAVGWGLETDAATMIVSNLAPALDETALRLLCARVECPVLVIHGDQDAVAPYAIGVALAEATHGELVLVDGGGHLVHARDPVKVNLLIRDFLRQPRQPFELTAQPPASRR
jgi:pimeloyl-ACP methyl ester carboxylesterase